MRVFCSCGSVSASHISSAAGAAEAAPFEEVQWKSAQPKPSRKIQQRQKAETAPEAAPEEAEAAAATEEKPRSNSEASRSLHHRRLPRPSDKDASHTTLKMGSGHFFWAIFYFASLCSASLANNAKINFREKEKKVLDQILGAGKYDARIRPSGINGTDGPAVVRVNIFVRSISKIDDVTMEYSVQLTFREQWTDERLKFDDIQGRLKYLTLTEANRVWMPDLFFSNEKEGHFHNIIMPNVYIRIFPNGSVLYSIRISLTLACPMNLKLYPLDRQICSLRMASYGWTTNDLVFLWKEGDPVQVVKNLHLPRFTLEKFLTDYCNSKTNTGEYSCLKVDLLFKREFSYYLIQIYIPCCMLVIVSWVSFWLDQGAVPARVSLGVTTLLTMATQTSGINASLPPVSYTKAIDVWTGVCLTFVFGALLEFALVNYASRSGLNKANMHKENMKKKRRDLEQASLDAASDLLDTDSNATFAMKPLVRHPGDPLALEKRLQCEVHMQAPKRPNCCKTWLSKFPTRQCSRSKRIDVISRITFPLVFALFNLVYWSTYLFREEEDETF
ncbi:glutamate-gated chloride channel isoform X1 [Drosophila bipectinata]